jgi:hypothetical protein
VAGLTVTVEDELDFVSLDSRSCVVGIVCPLVDVVVGVVVVVLLLGVVLVGVAVAGVVVVAGVVEVGVVVAVGVGVGVVVAGAVAVAASGLLARRNEAAEALLELPAPAPELPELCPVELSPSVSSSLARLASADCRAAFACSSVTSALWGSSVASSCPGVTCSPWVTLMLVTVPLVLKPRSS